MCHDPAMKRSRKIMGTALLLVLPLLAALLLVDATAHKLFQGRFSLSLITPKPSLMQPHPRLGWVPLPNLDTRASQIDFSARIRTNSKGLFDGEHAHEKPEGVFRVLLLGDSFLAGGYVEPDQLLPARLEASLSREREIEVINLGVISYSTIQEWLYLEEEGLRYQPDLVLLCFFAQNDVRNNARALEYRGWPEGHAMAVGRPYIEFSETGTASVTAPDLAAVEANIARNRAEAESFHWKYNPFFRAYSWQLLTLLRARGQESPEQALAGTQLTVGAFTTQFQDDPVAGGWSRERMASEWEHGWRATKYAVERIATLSKRAGAEFGVVLFPSQPEVESALQERVTELLPDSRFDFTLPQRKVQEWAGAHGFPVLDLTPAFTEAVTEQRLFNRLFDQHWTAAGHAVAAEAMENWLLREGMLP
jgi:hypothetical protein